MALLLAQHLRFSLSNLLGHVRLRTEHHVLNLFQIFFVLIEFFFQSHSCVDFLL